MTIPTLDVIVKDALSFFSSNPPPQFDVHSYTLPFVVGSENAKNTGHILFSNTAAIFADESNFKSIIASHKSIIDQKLIKSAVIISASGEKDSVWEIELAKSFHLETTLLTCKPHSSAAKLADNIVVYKSIDEPYTYNTSTYLGMVLSVTHEKPHDIQLFIDSLSIPHSLANYESYSFVLSDEFLPIAAMINTKDDELFGPHMTIRSYTHGHARHAKFVHRWDKELVISIGRENKHFGHPNHRWDIHLSEDSSSGTVLALSYYICGLVQKLKPDYFMQHIEAYCSDYGPAAYGKNGNFDVIVPANS